MTQTELFKALLPMLPARAKVLEPAFVYHIK